MIPKRQITNFANSDKYRKKIHQLIPGGAHTYSKGDDQFPLLSPAAISHGKGANLWDIDGNQFLDCSILTRWTRCRSILISIFRKSISRSRCTQ